MVNNEDVIDWGDEDLDESGDVISLEGYEDDQQQHQQHNNNSNNSNSNNNNNSRLIDKSTSTSNSSNFIYFDGIPSHLINSNWILKISSEGEPYFYNQTEKLSLWRCPGYPQPTRVSSTSQSVVTEPNDIKRRKVNDHQSLSSTINYDSQR